jgi:D-glycero-D-manno-heptose 1,7-bisphosphate phosphatase
MGGRWPSGAHSFMLRAVFLDRDGVLVEAIVRNGVPYSPATIEEMVIPSDAADALGALHRRGFRLIMVTNQPDIARGKIARRQVKQMNEHLISKLPLDAVEVCEHDDVEGCDCRKPKPGMLVRAAHRDGITLSESFMVGDRWRDIEAGRSAKCRTVLIGDGYAEGLRSPADVVVDNLSEAVAWILTQPPAKCEA